MKRLELSALDLRPMGRQPKQQQILPQDHGMLKSLIIMAVSDMQQQWLPKALTGPVHNTDTDLYYCTIQQAIDATPTQAGHILEVAAGTYPEQVNVTKGVILRGPNTGKAGNDGSRVSEAIVDGEGTHGCFFISAENVIIDGFKIIRSAGSQSPGGIQPWTGSTAGTEIINNIIFNTYHR